MQPLSEHAPELFLFLFSGEPEALLLLIGTAKKEDYNPPEFS